MNIKDIASETQEDTNILEKMFQHQEQLMRKYHVIESQNGFRVPTKVPLNLDIAADQSILKDFAWRVMEEIGEAIEAAEIHEDKDHCFEEMADGLHFLIEMSILCGFTPIDLKPTLVPSDDILLALFHISAPAPTVADSLYNVVKYLGTMMNCLKNKPWKTTHMFTDKFVLKEKWVSVWDSYIGVCKTMGMTHEILVDMYFRKYRVNEFRQRTSY